MSEKNPNAAIKMSETMMNAAILMRRDVVFISLENVIGEPRRGQLPNLIRRRVRRRLLRLVLLVVLLACPEFEDVPLGYQKLHELV